MIYYVSLDNPSPSGGVKTQYRHVEILNANGYPAAMLHQSPGFTAATWFKSNAPIVYNGQTQIGRGDLLVWPEILRSSIHNTQDGPRHAIFNQNVHYTWRGSFSDPTEQFSYERGIVGTMVLTDYERSFLESSVSNHRVRTVRHGIDPRIFNYTGQPKKKQICFMPRKHRDEAEAVFGWLRCTGAMAGWDMVPIDGETEEVSASIFKDSALFFAFGYPEGGTLPPFEAMACGAQVIGYGGFASDSLLLDAGGQRIPSGDTCRFAAVAADIIKRQTLDRAVCHEQSRRCLGLFPMEGEKDQLLSFMKEVL